MTVNYLSALGLAFDIGGVLFLGLALAASADTAIKRQAGTHIGFSGPVLRMLASQRIDARIGLPSLIVGFCLQFVASLGLHLAQTEFWLMLGLSTLIFVGIGYDRDIWAENSFRKMFKELIDESLFQYTNIVDAAKAAIRHYGPDAAAHASLRVDETSRVGDTELSNKWASLESAIRNELSADTSQ